LEYVNFSKGELTLNAVDRQLQRIAQVFGKVEPPEVKARTLKIFLKHLKENVELPCRLTGRKISSGKSITS